MAIVASATVPKTTGGVIGLLGKFRHSNTKLSGIKTEEIKPILMNNVQRLILYLF